LREAKKNFTGISEQALEQFGAYDRPGNVRELANVIERAIMLGAGPKINPNDLPARIVLEKPKPKSQELSYHEAIDGFRKEPIEKALTQREGSRVAAARALRIQRTYLSRLFKTLRIN
jgi:transcriptional regulator with PAS, ATPase and Fis domain